MLKAEQVPDEVIKAALLTDERLGMREVIAAALNAWPNKLENGHDEGLILTSAAIILPCRL